MLYACESCKYQFESEDKIEQCPDCGKFAVRPVGKEKGVLSKIISFGILLVTLTFSMVVFDGPRVYDIVIMLVLAYFLLLANSDLSFRADVFAL